MKYLLINSSEDIAGTNIKNNFKNINLDEIYTICPNCKIDFLEVESKLVQLTNNDIPKNYDYYIFLSKHRSNSSSPPTLTVHTSGNLTEDNKYGGNSEEVCYCDGILNTLLLKNINKYNNIEEYKRLGFIVSFEALHHGPSDLTAPSAFVEIGNSEKQWGIEKAGELISKSIIDTIKNIELNNYDNLDIAVGIGGGHYSPKFTKLALEEKYYIGYLIPKYAKLSENMLNKLIKHNNFNIVLIDWKGLNSIERKKYIDFFNKHNVNWLRV